jgi:transposase
MHVDYFYSIILLTRVLTEEETESNYEYNKRKVAKKTLAQLRLSSPKMTGIIVARDGSFT